MGVQFVIDSSSDITPDEAKVLGCIHVPLCVSFGTETYRDSVDLDHKGFYEKLIESDTLPVTSQPNPSVYEKILEEIDPGDDVVIMTLSSALSGTYQSAMIAAENYPGRVHVVDTLSVTVGERLLILRACALRDKGASAEEIVAALEKEKYQVRVMAMLDTLEYLKKGGRISATVAFAGGLLSIKPVVAVENGAVAMVGKARGSKNAGNLLRQLVEQCGGIDFDRPYALAYSGLSDNLIRKYMEDHGDLWRNETDHLPVTTVGCVIGTHVGPGAIAVAFFEKN